MRFSYVVAVDEKQKENVLKEKLIICSTNTLFKEMSPLVKKQWDEDAKEPLIKKIKRLKEIVAHFQKEERIFAMNGERKTPNQTIIDLPEEVLNTLRQMNPRDVANILVN